MKIQLPSNLTGAIQSADYRKLDDGKIWFGQADKDPRSYPIDTFLDKAMTIPAPPFFWLKMGYLSHNGNIVDVYVPDDVGAVSILITDVYGRQLAYLSDYSVDGNTPQDKACECGILPPVPIMICENKQVPIEPKPISPIPDGSPIQNDGPLTYVEQRVGFFATREFNLEMWQDYLNTNKPPAKQKNTGQKIYDKHFFIDTDFERIAERLASYLYFNDFREAIERETSSTKVGRPVLYIASPYREHFANKNKLPYDGTVNLDDMVQVNIPNSGYFGSNNPNEMISIVQNGVRNATNIRYIGTKPDHYNKPNGHKYIRSHNSVPFTTERIHIEYSSPSYYIGFVQEMITKIEMHRFYIKASLPVYVQTIHFFSKQHHSEFNKTLAKLNLMGEVNN